MPTRVPIATPHGRGSGGGGLNAAVPTGHPTSAPSHAPTLRRGYLNVRNLLELPKTTTPPKMSSTSGALFSVAFSFVKDTGVMRFLLWYMVIICCVFIAQLVGVKKNKADEDMELPPQFMHV